MGFLRRFGPAGLVLLGAVSRGGFGQGTQQVVPSQAETLSLEGAIARASANEPAFAAALAAQKSAALDQKIARTALLPTATYHNQVLYTEPNGVPTSRIGQTTNAAAPIFIANNAVREYVSQGLFDEKLGLGQVGAIRLADASAALASAELEIARRGLVATVANLFYGAGASSGRTRIAQQALEDANHFVDLTQKREAAREAARADVLKAQLQQQQRQRELLDAQLVWEKVRVELGVLLYPDPRTAFNVDIPETPEVLPEFDVVQNLASKANPEIRSALASVQVSEANAYAVRSALLPQVALNATYGIDATNFGVNGPDGIHNLGYSLSAQLDIPVWDWLATERKVKQARIGEQAAKVAWTAAQRRALANLMEFFAEARAAEQQLLSLKQSISTARESLRLTNLRYVDGESTALEVVDAESALISAENAEIDGRTRYELALANLETLTGTL